MYYSDDVIDQVQTANDIVDVIGQSVQLKRSGSSYMGLCPFHNEKTPSFSVSRQKQMYYCFGCHRGGNVITFVEEYNNMTFTEAMQYLADRAGIKLPEREASDEERSERTERERLLEINKLAGAWYYYSLRSPAGKPGMDYLTGRKLSPETMKSFGLGFAPKSPSDGLYRYLKSKGIRDDELRMSGLMNVDGRRGSMYDKFWNRVIFPIMDTSDRIIGFGGRVMGDGKPKYLNSPETRLFDKSRSLYALNLARRARENYLILCEGYMDVISMHQAGFGNTVASLGTALTPGHCATLSRYTKDVILSYDSDKAGVNAAIRAIPMLKRAGITPRILKLEPYKDPDEFINALGPDAMKDRLKNAQNALMFEIGVSRRNYNLDDPGGKTKFFENAADKIAALETQMERQSYIDAVSREYMTDKQALGELVTRRLMLGPSRVRASVQHETGAVSDPGSYQGTDGNQIVYQDEATGEVWQTPTVSAGTRRGAALKEQGETVSRQLLLNYITQYPSLFPVVCKYVSEDDFGDGNSVTAQAAHVIFKQLRDSGRVDEASVLSRFPDTTDQKIIAGIFHMMDPGTGPGGRQKAFTETLLKVYRASRQAECADFKEAVARKNRERDIRNLKIQL